jgi:hypothetical protein
VDRIRLVQYPGEWLVALRGQYPTGETVADAWLYGNDGQFLCWVGNEDISYVLPDWQPTNFLGDRFPFAIDRQYDFEEKPEKVGGSVNALAAIAAYEEFVRRERSNETMRLRHGARVIREEKGTLVR